MVNYIILIFLTLGSYIIIVLLVNSPELSLKTGQMHLRCQHFEVNETCHVCFVGLETKLLGSGTMNFGLYSV